MLMFSEAVSLALHGALLLASSGGPRTSRELAKEMGASEAHLAKVMRRLAKAGFVRATPGPGGGYVLSEKAGERSLLDVYELIDGPFEVRRCLLDRPICGGRRCLFGDLLEETHRGLRERLAGTRLRDLKGALADAPESVEDAGGGAGRDGDGA